MPADSDEIRRAQAGDREAFGALVRRHQRRVYATAYRVVGNHSDADDLMQEAFLRAFRALRTFDGRADFFTWLYRIVVNLALNHLRRVRRHGTVAIDEKRPQPGEADGGRVERQLEAKDLCGRVEDAIDRLPPAFKLTVILAVIEELPHKQVASMMGCSEGTVAWRVNQARKMLRTRLAPVLGAAQPEEGEEQTPAASGAAGKNPGARRVLDEGEGVLEGLGRWLTAARAIPGRFGGAGPVEA